MKSDTDVHGLPSVGTEESVPVFGYVQVCIDGSGAA